MTFNDACKEFELDCKVRNLSSKTIDNYTKQLRYLDRYLSSEFSILNIEEVKPTHIKSFMSRMDDAGRKPQYINDLLKVFKTFFTYLEAEGHIDTSPAKRIRNMRLPKLKLRTFTEKNIIDMINFYKEIRVSPHTCRHTFAHLNLKNGIDLYTLSRLLGHESVSITQRYLEGITDEGVIKIARKSGVLENISRL